MEREKDGLEEGGYFKYEWLKEMTLDMIPNRESLSYQIAEAIGIENFMKLTKLIGGARVYIPTYESAIKPVRDKKMKEDFNGYNHRELAKKYGVSENWVSQICGRGCLCGQQNLFEYMENL